MLTVEEHPVDAIPFSPGNPPLVVKAEPAPVAWDWADGFDPGSAVTPVNSIPLGAAQEMAPVPYGCA